MAFKLALNPFRDPAEGIGWDEQAVRARADVSRVLEAYPDGPIQFAVTEGDHGIGADAPILILEIVGLTSTLFFGIPAAHKKLRETLSEWKRIATNVKNVVSWVSARIPVTSYSIEVAFYHVLLEVAAETRADELEPVEATLFWGRADSLSPSFDSAPLAYYLFAFREGDERLYLFVVDSALRIHVRTTLPLDPRFRP